MSLDQATAPTVAGEEVADPLPAERTRLEYFRSYQQPLHSANWAINLLWGMLAFFSSGVIPIVGPMVWTGYLYECVEALAASRGRMLPDFDVNRFGEYITRGVFPFFVQMVSWLGLGAAYLLLYLFMFLSAMAASAVGQQHLVIALTIGGILYAFTVAAIVVLPLIVLAPLMLRLGLSQDVAIGFQLRWSVDFLRRMWPEITATTLFVLMTGAILTTLGCVLFIVGSYFAWAWATLANAHLSWQLYELYLARGGEPIPLKPRKVMPPPYRQGSPFPPGYSPSPPAPRT